MGKILWKDISIGDVFKDGSKVKSIHESYEADCYKIFYKNNNFLSRGKNCVLSDTHLLLIDLKKLNKECLKWAIYNFGNCAIATDYNKHIYFKDDTFTEIAFEENEVVKYDFSKVTDSKYWLPIKAIFLLVRNFKQKLYCNGNLITSIEYFGNNEVFCVETDTHKFETCDLIHHNSVTLRDIIFHCLTHGEQISVALIDLKWTEFTPFKGMKNVVAVANTVQEAVEVMRVGREVMYKRNQELAKLKLNDIKNFKPNKPTDEVIVAGRRLKDSDTLEIKTKDGELKTVTVKELENYIE